ncbi:MAG TPA: hypothetical protein VE029_04675 [Rhizobacter sp.]|nr:hypothetical protein [Rhizobacter sp.]
MNPIFGWLLAAAAVVVGWTPYGWQGAVAMLTAVAFWLLLQFNRALRVMKNAANTPVGHVDSAVMLNAKLNPGMTLMQVVTLTRSLGQHISDSPETWSWTDAGGSGVTLVFDGAKLSRWNLTRPEASPTA